ncbi:MAG: hypothetical protein NZ741_12600, partial [Armatimonadetes bacterium]|nr:hypothetical protein [Armatimonadota bacterium]
SVKKVQVFKHAFQSLIGRLVTAWEPCSEGAVDAFQSLIGRLVTDPGAQGTGIGQTFQSLIGRLVTDRRLCAFPSTRHVSIPHR